MNTPRCYYGVQLGNILPSVSPKLVAKRQPCPFFIAMTQIVMDVDTSEMGISDYSLGITTE